MATIELIGVMLEIDDEWREMVSISNLTYVYVQLSQLKLEDGSKRQSSDMSMCQSRHDLMDRDIP